VRVLPALSPRSATPYTWPTRSAARRHPNDRPAEVLPICGRPKRQKSLKFLGSHSGITFAL